MARLEYKYLVSKDAVPRLRKMLQPYVYSDQYSDQNADKQYTVRSLYYDTIHLDFYHDKIAGLKKRIKLRIRGYDELQPESITFLEIKRKNGPVISKSRAPVPYAELVKFINNGDAESSQAFLDRFQNGHNEARQFFFHLYKSNLKPTIKIIYEREAFYYKFSQKLRITIDKNLRSSLILNPEFLYEEQNVVYSMPRYSILEIKIFGDIPFWLQHIIAELQLRHQAISKYTICMDSHSPYELNLDRSLQGRGKYNQHKHFASWEINR